MDTENNSNTENKKISEVLEEAARRHREIEVKIHPEKYGVNISAKPDEKKTDEKKADEKKVDEKTEEVNSVSTPVIEEKILTVEVKPVEEKLTENISTKNESDEDNTSLIQNNTPEIIEDFIAEQTKESGPIDIDEITSLESISIPEEDILPEQTNKTIEDLNNIKSRHSIDAKETIEPAEITEPANLIETTETEQSKDTTDSIQVISAAVPSTETTEPFITDFDLHLFSQGTFYKIYEKFGAHLAQLNGASGVYFTTWAPNAEKIYLIGEFNGWQETEEYQLKKIHESGIWSAFIAGLTDGDTYKYSIKSVVDGELRRKADPYAFRSEVRPKNASIVANINKYIWSDSEWMSSRGNESFKNKPMNIYEVHLGSWRRDKNNPEFPNEWGYLSYSQLATEIVAYVKKMGYTHIELLPVMEHPLDISWGYQVTHYYAPTSRFGSPDDFMYFVDYCHQNGIGVILDWVPAHFPYDEHALAYFDGKQIYAYENIKRGVNKDWGTFIFDYGKPEVQNFLIGSALFWLEKYHADGLRVDAVASMLYLDYSREQGEWEPNIHGGKEHLEAIGFLKHLNEKVHEYHKGDLMIAEESTSWPGVSHPVNEGGLGFDMKWNMGWMNDILLYFSKDPVYRKFHQGKITFSLWYAFSENFILPISHDEVVHGKKSLLEKMPGDNWQKFANLRLFLGFMAGHPGKKLNFMTTDIAQYNEWNCEESVEWGLLQLDLNKELNLFAEDINRLYKNHKSLYEVDFNSEGFQWLDFTNALQSVLAFIRVSADKKQILLFTFNMTPTVRNEYQIGVPESGYWKEILNSDAEVYGGSGIGNMGGKESEPIPYKDWQQSIKVTLPPLAVNVYKWEKDKAIEPGIVTVEDLYVDTDTGGGE